jgi:hypothetical protein
MDPCWPESERLSGLSYSWSTDSLAFAVVFQDRYDAQAERNEDLEVMVTCEGLGRAESVTCHETSLRTWRRFFPKLDLPALVAKAAANPKLVAP